MKSTKTSSQCLDLYVTHPDQLLFTQGCKCWIVLISRKCVPVSSCSRCCHNIQKGSAGLGYTANQSKLLFWSGFTRWRKGNQWGKSMAPSKGRFSFFFRGHVKVPREHPECSSHRVRWKRGELVKEGVMLKQLVPAGSPITIGKLRELQCLRFCRDLDIPWVMKLSETL